jgi:hypothetical protein
LDQTIRLRSWPNKYSFPSAFSHVLLFQLAADLLLGSFMTLFSQTGGTTRQQRIVSDITANHFISFQLVVSGCGKFYQQIGSLLDLQIAYVYSGQKAFPFDLSSS